MPVKLPAGRLSEASAEGWHRRDSAKELPCVLSGVMAVSRAPLMARAEALISLTGWLKRTKAVAELLMRPGRCEVPSCTTERVSAVRSSTRVVLGVVGSPGEHGGNRSERVAGPGRVDCSVAARARLLT